MLTDSEVILHIKKNLGIKQTEIAKDLNVSTAFISKISLGKKNLPSDSRKFLIEKYNIDNNDSDEKITMKYFTEVCGSCGLGVFAQSQNYELLTVSKSLIKRYSKTKFYSIINAVGDSMLPFIHNNDKLIVQHYEGEQISDNHIYVFLYLNEIFVKRLVKNIDEIIIISDNKEEIYRPRIIEKQNINEIKILGEVVGLYRNC